MLRAVVPALIPNEILNIAVIVFKPAAQDRFAQTEHAQSDAKKGK